MPSAMDATAEGGLMAVGQARSGVVWGRLLVGAVVGIIGFGLLQYGRSLMNRGIMPTRTQTQVQRDAEMLKEQVK